MDSLPIELLDIIVSFDPQAYYGLLGYKFFTNRLTPNKRVDFMILFGYSVKITQNSIQWYLNGERHRVDGPAIEWVDGTKQWYFNGQRHRINGPAIECTNGDKDWYLNGELHRVDGPAVESANGDKEWYSYGGFIRKE